MTNVILNAGPIPYECISSSLSAFRDAEQLLLGRSVGSCWLSR